MSTPKGKQAKFRPELRATGHKPKRGQVEGTLCVIEPEGTKELHAKTKQAYLREGKQISTEVSLGRYIIRVYAPKKKGQTEQEATIYGPYTMENIAMMGAEKHGVCITFVETYVRYTESGSFPTTILGPDELTPVRASRTPVRVTQAALRGPLGMELRPL